MIPFSRVSMGEEEVEAVSAVIRSGWLAAGEQTVLFEKEFAEYIGAKYFIFTNSCTSALKISYKWAKEQGIRSIAYPKNTFCATYAAADETGLSHYAYYSNEYDPNVTREWRVNVHYGGVFDPTPCLIEDSAHRIEPKDQWAGKIKCYSFYATKNLSTGSGGGLATNDDAVYECARLFWRDGLSTSTADRLRGEPGYRVEAMSGGYDGNDLAAAMGRVQLRRLPGFTARRNAVVGRYNDAFGQRWLGNHLYPYFVGDEAEAYRMIAYMREKGVICGYHYPGTGWNGVSLPLYPLLTDGEVEHVVAAVKSYSDARAA